MTNEKNEQRRAALDEWRTKLDGLKVKGSLLKMEYRDKQDEVVGQISAAYDKAKTNFDGLLQAGEDQATKLDAGFDAAWDAFKDAYKNATD